MRADVEFIVLPYDAAEGRSILHLLLEQLSSNAWTEFRSAVAFAKASGNFDQLLAALLGFVKRGGHLSMTFGADVFAGNIKGSDYNAIEELLQTIKGHPNARLHLYHEGDLVEPARIAQRTFHP
jgi:hypothetical protein